MTWIDWIIALVPVALVMGLGIYASTFVKGVSDFLVAGRICHRYVLNTSNMACALGLVTLVAYVEVAYRTGFALNFWGGIMMPVGVMISLTGYCMYRFRETRAMSLGQFLEMRYNRSLRIFACFLRSVAEMMANVIMPAIAARFFIYYLGLPTSINIFGWECPCFWLIMVITLSLAITLICLGGQLAIVVTDSLQGIIFFPVILILLIFVLTKFGWNTEIIEVMGDRVAGESFLDPFDIAKLRDFNIFMLIINLMNSFLHQASGVSGTGGSAVSAHEAKMASILSAWRGAFTTILFVLIALAIITIMHHSNYAQDAKVIRTGISRQIATEFITDTAQRQKFMADIEAIPVMKHQIGVDKPFSQTENPDEIYFTTAQKNFGLDGEGSSQTQQFKTLFHQLLLPAAMRHMLPTGLVGMFCMMIILFILSTDDSRIYSASSTLVQDCVVPFYKSGQLTPEKHIAYIRYFSIGVGLFFLLGSYFMAQLDYINLFIQIMYGMWMGGCGPMLVFGLYSRFGTAAGAWCSLVVGMGINFLGMLAQRNWADNIYPFLEEMGYVDSVGNFLTAVSKPFNPYIVWEMNRLKFPINSYEIYFIAVVLSLVVYIVVSYATCRKPFNLERMLHRGKYAIEGEKALKMKWNFKNILNNLISITPEYTKGDRIMAWAVFIYSFGYRFFLTFVLVAVWNVFSPWPLKWWEYYFLIVMVLIPGVMSAVTAVWFGIGSSHDLWRMFQDLKHRVVNPLDNGMVSGHVAVAEQQQIDQIEKEKNQF